MAFKKNNVNMNNLVCTFDEFRNINEAQKKLITQSQENETTVFFYYLRRNREDLEWYYNICGVPFGIKQKRGETYLLDSTGSTFAQNSARTGRHIRSFHFPIKTYKMYDINNLKKSGSKNIFFEATSLDGKKFIIYETLVNNKRDVFIMYDDTRLTLALEGGK